MPHISAIIPVLNEESIIDELCQRVGNALAGIDEDYEVVIVDDGSTDKTWSAIQENATANPRIKGIRFARNFGQHYAITAGLDAVDGDYVVVMDGDLQDRPEVIPDLYAKAKEGYDVVFVARQERPESILYLLFQRLFVWSVRYLAKTDYDPTFGNFSIISRKVVENVKVFRENLRFYGGVLFWLGFPRTSVTAKHGERFSGAPSYNLKRRLKLAFDIIIAHSERPLVIAVGLGLVTAGISFLFGLYIVFRAVFNDVSVEGWASLIVSIWFVGGMIMTLIGISGIYVGKIFNEIKKRPLYVVAQSVGFDARKP